jgi:hypothetical protein
MVAVLVTTYSQSVWQCPADENEPQYQADLTGFETEERKDAMANRVYSSNIGCEPVSTWSLERSESIPGLRRPASV